MKKFASRRLELALGFAGLSLLTSGCGMLPKTHSEPDHVFAPPQMMQDEEALPSPCEPSILREP